MNALDLWQILFKGVAWLAITWLAFKFIFKNLIIKALEESIKIFFFKKQTEIAESVRISFNKSLEKFKQNLQIDIAKEIEPFKAALNRDNITFQLNQTEFIKRRFLRLEELFAKFYNMRAFLHRKAVNNSFRLSAKDHEELNEILNDCILHSYLSTFYLNEDAKKTIKLYLATVTKLSTKSIEYKRLKDDFDYMEHHDFSISYSTEDDFEVVEWSEEDITKSKQSMKEIVQECFQTMEECKVHFSHVEAAIQNTLSQYE